ncbi:helix-turn-helix transcriptional regulator [Clostridium sp. 19966]|uniref:AraC family transcriptional regulator n=1 Tax=Clostridium sp. 19966 TaxID=2768166 RepID=UPI0028DF9710|nr:AraC family transcriptional regulator [Clostridium sp. 19966]MDT8718615.1 helix-turn-helix transcriptional regulator [Clostridium sp. 19966]
MPFCLLTEAFPKVSFMGRTVSEDWFHFPRITNEYLLFILNSGTLYIKEDDINYELHEGDILLLEPERYHVGYKSAAIDYFFIHMPPTTFSPMDFNSQIDLTDFMLKNWQNYFKSNPFSYEPYSFSKLLIPKTMRLENKIVLKSIYDHINEAIQAYETRNEYYKYLCSCKMLEILISISKEYSNMILSTGSKSQPYFKKDEKIEEVLTFLHDSYPKKIKGLDIENSINMNFDYLNRLFKKQIGLSIFEYLTIYRINKAKELLINSDKKAYEIAALTGFSNEYHFNRVFSQKVGMPPGKFRERYLM